MSPEIMPHVQDDGKLDKAVLQGVEPDPAGERFVPGNGHLVIDRRPANSDLAAAADPQTQVEHGLALKVARDLRSLVTRRHNSLSDAWADLKPTVDGLVTLLDRPTEELPGKLADMFMTSDALGSFFEQDDRLRAQPEPDEQALPADLRRVVGNTVTAVAVLTRAFPTNRLRDQRLRDYWRADSVRAAIAATVAASENEILSADDAIFLEQMSVLARRDGKIGLKERGRLVASNRNLLLASALFVTTTLVAPAYVNESPLFKRIAGFMVQAETAALGLLEGLPADVASAIRHALDRARESADVPSRPATVGSRRRDPPDDFDMARARRILLDGEALPSTWLPFITELAFDDEPLESIGPLSALTELEVLDLSGTGVSDLAPLANLAKLVRLNISRTQVTDISPISGLNSLRKLQINQTKIEDFESIKFLSNLKEFEANYSKITDLKPLSNLVNLKKISIDKTNVVDLTPLREIRGLREISIAYSKVSDISALENFFELYSIAAWRTKISNLAPLSKCNKLRLIWLNDSDVHDLSPLASLSDLSFLSVQGSNVTDLSPLVSNARLRVRIAGKELNPASWARQGRSLHFSSSHPRREDGLGF